jgi:septin family protein
MKSEEEKEEEIFVVSVVGPQSSGKSQVLDNLFGTQFLSKRERGTRGIQGCLIDIHSQNKFKKMLILDTERIQSAEAVDEDFDKRFMFYLLSMSHLVLICNMGEMNESTQDTIKLANECILQLREKLDHQPQVNIVMSNV